MGGLTAALERVALADLSSWPRLLASGPDILGLLHRLSTADLLGLAPGEGRPTVITSPKGRIVARLIVLHLGDEGVLLLGGPETGARTLAHLTKYAMGADIGISDQTAATRAFALVGPGAAEAGLVAGFPDRPPFGVASILLDGRPARAARTNGFDADGWLTIASDVDADPVRTRLERTAGAREGGWLSAHELEAWRILTGRPLAGNELTEDHNPLEAGLRDAVSFTKGCYVGQEVVARLNTYDKVARGIVQLRFEPGSLPAAGAKVVVAGREVGAVTSAVLPPGHDAGVALAYVKHRDVPEGTEAVEVVWDGGRSAARVLSR